MGTICKMILCAWVVNACLFVVAWFGGDYAMHNGYEYLRESIQAMRITLAFTKLSLSIAILVMVVDPNTRRY